MPRPKKYPPTRSGRGPRGREDSRNRPILRDVDRARGVHRGGAVPATVWAPPPGAVGPAWLAWVHRSIRDAFLPPTGQMLDLTDHFTRPADIDGQHAAVESGAPAQQAMPVVPFWAHLLNPGPGSGPATHDQPIGVVAAAGSGVGELRADLVFADLRDAAVDDRIGMLGWSALRRGGILAVLTRCHTGKPGPTTGLLGEGSGDLADSTGQIVASAQNADLLYLQHIVIPTAPLLPPATTTTTTVDAAAAATVISPTNTPDSDGAVPSRGDNPVQRRHGHAITHADLLIFMSPRGSTLSHPGPDPLPPGRAGMPVGGAR